MRPLTPFEQRLAMEAAARHRIPKAEVTHPAGVIVPYDTLLTENIKDPDYVPYCGPCVPMQRLRRVEDGFVCPTCGNRANWDLTKFNHNVDVKFDPELVDPVWLKQHEKNVEAIRAREQLHQETYTTFKEQFRDWVEDRNKKNTLVKQCPGCQQSFFGKRSRKRCAACAKIQRL